MSTKIFLVIITKDLYRHSQHKNTHSNLRSSSGSLVTSSDYDTHINTTLTSMTCLTRTTLQCTSMYNQSPHILHHTALLTREILTLLFLSVRPLHLQLIIKITVTIIVIIAEHNAVDIFTLAAEFTD